MNLEDMNHHAASCRELLVADMALEVFGFLVLHENLLVVELSVAVIAPHLLRRSLLLLPHHQKKTLSSVFIPRLIRIRISNLIEDLPFSSLSLLPIARVSYSHKAFSRFLLRSSDSLSFIFFIFIFRYSLCIYKKRTILV